ncbi:hypothetical protein HPP92_013828 [Vanilla planifolia]|uniref:Protein kinase domain-containing protein n=1 Tax=Vanilla planifolia TaxID=51239 RepID=A0A835QYH7_VANPL|nr:hypothetical protein HPP92_013828 [Vanilla planifolia]
MVGKEAPHSIYVITGIDRIKRRHKSALRAKDISGDVFELRAASSLGGLAASMSIKLEASRASSRRDLGCSMRNWRRGRAGLLQGNNKRLGLGLEKKGNEPIKWPLSIQECLDTWEWLRLEWRRGPKWRAEPSYFYRRRKRRAIRYELGRLLGQGTFAKVYHARNIKTSQSVAIKLLTKRRSSKLD